MSGEGQEGGREGLERIVGLARGPKGEQGEQGTRGERGLSRIQGRAVVVLFLLAALFGTSNWYWSAREVRSDNANWHQAVAAQQRQAAAEQAAQRRQGEQLEAKLCASLARQAALKPPGGSPVNNPSRAYLQQQHEVLAELGPDIGCGNARLP